MIRTLFIIAGASFVLTVLCFGGAVALGGKDIAEKGWNAENWADGWGWSDGFEREDWEGPQITREVPWNGEDEIVIAHGGEVRFTQGEPAKVVVTGAEKGVSQLIMVDGRLRMPGTRNGEEGVPLSNRVRLQVDITAPNVDTFRVWGSSKLRIENYDQPTLNLAVLGSGDIVAKGKASAIDIEIAGSGSADVAEVESEEVHLSIAGSGDVAMAPTRLADIEIAGSGDVDLLSNPTEVKTDIAGSGDVRHVAPRAKSDTAPASPAPPKAPSAPGTSPT
jgi:hypothetical protein